MVARRVSSGLACRAALLLGAPVIVSCGGLIEPDSTAQSRSAVVNATITLAAPKGMSVLAPVVESATSLQMQPFAKVMPSAPVVVMGTSGTTLAEPDIQLNDLWSRGPVTLKDRATILGVVHTTSLNLVNLTLPAAKKDLSPVFEPVSSLSWTVTYPSTVPTDILVNSSGSQTKPPGVYGSVTLNGAGAELTLKSGVYYTTSLALNSDTKIWLDQASGPVIIYTTSVSGGFRSIFASLDGSPPDLLVVHLGTTEFFIEKPFSGAVVVPNAKLTIRTAEGGHSGFFAAKSVLLDANAVINYRVPNVIATAVDPPTKDGCKELIQKRPDLTGDAQQAAYVADLARYCGITAGPECTDPTDSDSDGTPNCKDGCPYDKTKTEPGTSGCSCQSELDSDLDLTWDCFDGCPYDPAKTAPGAAGCGVAEVPDDGDRVPPGLDQCGADSRKIDPGDCGCVGGVLAPAGTPCGDPPCPGQPAPVCDGAGNCGSSPATCQPATDCTEVSRSGDSYFICGGNVPGGTGTVTPRPWVDVAQVCRAKGLVPARVDTYEQGQVIRKLLESYGIAKAWLGGNQISVPNTWRWATATGNDGDTFWSGGATGSPVNGRFNFWASANPGAVGRCLAMQSSDGRWVNTSCSQALPYVCQNLQVPHGWTPPPPPVLTDPVPPLKTGPGQCVDEYSGGAPLPAPGQLNQLQAQYDAAHSSTPVFYGAAANPPTPGTPCQISRASENCEITNIQSPVHAGCTSDCDCIDDAECKTQFGSSYVCRAVRDNLSCVPDPDTKVTCSARNRCGIPNCTPYPNSSSCSEIDICPTSDTQEYNTAIDSESALSTTQVDPGSFFPGPKPDTTQSPTYEDPSYGSGTGHSWCRLDPQATGKVADAKQNHLGKEGKSGKGSKIQFSFTPDLIFEANPNPLAFGESQFGLHAQASLVASANLTNFLEMSWHGDILAAIVGIQASRCSVTTGETSFKILGNDFTDFGSFVPHVNTASFTGPDQLAVDGCNVGIAKFLRGADRLKKAFRDAQQLLSQYNTIKAGGKRFGSNFCKDLGIEDIAGSELFPGAGVCPGREPPEETINRFIDYYQDGAIGEIARLGNVTTALNQASSLLRDKVAAKLGSGIGSPKINAPFVDFKRSESKTVLKAPFFIGPVPMTIDIAVVASYGLKGSFVLDLSLPTSLGTHGNFSNPNSPVLDQIASAKVGVEPWASAGMTLFVGCSIGIASVGIEGGVTLARLSAPINAGVGIALATTPDGREPPPDIKAVSVMDGTAPKYLIPPSAYQFYLTYGIGANVNVSEILAGEVNGKLTIDFWLFSRTWRKRIVKFNGLANLSFPLINQQGNMALVAIPGGSNLLTASANAAMGRSEAQIPFTYLTRLTVPDAIERPAPPAGGAGGAGGAAGAAGGPSTIPVASVDKTQVEKFLYDNLCCLQQGDACNEADRLGCCEPLQCTGGTCQPKPAPACAIPGASCGYDVDLGVAIGCCSGDACPLSGVCPVACLPDNAPCTPGGAAQCCNGWCGGGSIPGTCGGTLDPPCAPLGGDCSGAYCCGKAPGLPGSNLCLEQPDGAKLCTYVECLPLGYYCGGSASLPCCSAASMGLSGTNQCTAGDAGTPKCANIPPDPGPA